MEVDINKGAWLKIRETRALSYTVVLSLCSSLVYVVLM